MTQHFDPKPLGAFFHEVAEQLNIQLKYFPDNTEFPIQLSDSTQGIPKTKWFDLMQFIKLQTDLRENQIGKSHPIKDTKNVFIEISNEATRVLSEVYALGFFYDIEEETESNKE